MIFVHDSKKLSKLKKADLVLQLGCLSWLVVNEMEGRGLTEFTTSPLRDVSFREIELETDGLVPNQPAVIRLRKEG